MCTSERGRCWYAAGSRRTVKASTLPVAVNLQDDWGSEAQCSPDRLVSQWREEVDTLRKRGATAQAVTLESCADEMETALKDWQEQLLTPEQAARETGYSAEHLRRKVRAGQLSAERHKGAKSHIKIRRGDLPTKSQGDRGASPDIPYDPIEDARSIAQRLGGSHV